MLHICNCAMISRQSLCANLYPTFRVVVRGPARGRARGTLDGGASAIAKSRHWRASRAMSTIDHISFSGGSAKVGIWTRDHCPPHATVREDTREWTMKIEFSFADAYVGLHSIRTIKSAPSADAIDTAIDTVRGNRRAYRTRWWNYQRQNPANDKQGGPCCLNNQITQRGAIATATYDPTRDERTLRFKDGTSITEPANS